VECLSVSLTVHDLPRDKGPLTFNKAVVARQLLIVSMYFVENRIRSKTLRSKTARKFVQLFSVLGPILGYHPLLFNGGLMRMLYLLNGRPLGPITCLFRTTIALFLFIFFAVHGICWAGERYMYDEYNRLTRVDDTSVEMEFEYDGAGNRIAIRSDASDTCADRDRNPHHHARHGKRKHHKPCQGRQQQRGPRSRGE
jgi:YD repeat-containing protein